MEDTATAKDVAAVSVVLVPILLGLLGTTAVMYLKLARAVMTKAEHKEECSRVSQGVYRDIGEVKESLKRLERKGDESAKDLRLKLDAHQRDLLDRLQSIWREMAKMNGNR